MEVDEDLENSQKMTVTLSDAMITIFESCDVDKTDLVQVSELINLIKPFFPVENWRALNELHRTLDPEAKNISVNSNRFYDVMRQWAKKMELTAAQEEQLNKSKSLINEDDGEKVPFTHSTPKSSSGYKEARKSKDSLSMSNVSGYSLSTSQYEQPEVDNTEEIKKLEHRLQKIVSELAQTKEQLIANEELNEILQQDVLKLNQKLHAEQHVNENLRKDKRDNEQLREDLIDAKATIDQLRKILVRFQKDCSYYENQAKEVENEKTQIEKLLKSVTKKKIDCSRELHHVRTQLQAKEDTLNQFTKSLDELQQNLSEQQKCIDELQEENRELDYQKTALEDAVKSKSQFSYLNLGEQLSNDSTSFDTVQDYSTLTPSKNSTSFDTAHDYSTPPPLNNSTQLQIFHQYSIHTPSHLKSNLKSAVLITQTSTPNNDAAILHFCISSVGLNNDGEPELVEENIYFEVKPSNPNDMTGKSSNFDISLVFKKVESEIDLLRFENDTFKLQFQAAQCQSVHYVSDVEYLKKLYEEITLNAELVKQLEFSNAKIAKLENLLDEMKKKLPDKIQVRVNLDKLQLAELEKTLAKNFELVVTSMELDKKILQGTEDCDKQEPEPPLLLQIPESQALEEANIQVKLSAMVKNDNIQSKIVVFDRAKPVMKFFFGKIVNAENNKVVIRNKIQCQDSPIEASDTTDPKICLIKQIKSFEEIQQQQLSISNGLNEKYETLLKSHEELTIEYNHLKLNNEKISENYETLLKSHEELTIDYNHLKLNNEKTSDNLHQAVKAQIQKDLVISVIEKRLKESTELNEKLVKTKETLELALKDETGTTHELKNKNMQLEQTNAELNQAIDVFAIDKQKLVNELAEVSANLLLIREKYNLINQEQSVLHQQLEEQRELDKKFEDLQQKYTLSELNLKNQCEKWSNLQKLYLEIQTENNLNEQEIYNLKLKLGKHQASRSFEKSISPNNGGSTKRKSYGQLEAMIVRLEEKMENLDDKYEKEKTKNQQLKNRISSMDKSIENLEKIEQLTQTDNNLNQQEICNSKHQASRSFEKSMPPNNGSSTKRKSYGQLEAMIIRLEEKLENLDDKYGKEKTKNQQLKIRLSSMDKSNENLEKIEQLIIEKRKSYDELNMAFAVKHASYLHGLQVDLNQSNEKTMGKFTVLNRVDRVDRPDSPSLGIEDINLGTKEKLSLAFHSFLEVPSLDVNCFIDDFLRDFSLDTGLSGKSLTPEEEKKMTNLLSHLLANSNTVEKQLEFLSEKYNCQYKNMLMLIRDVSYHLRDYNTDNAATIVPAYDLLKEIEIQLKELVQNAGQVGALICENRELPFRVWAINYVAAIKQNHEARSRENRSTQTVTRRYEWVFQKTNQEYIPKKRSKFYHCIIAFIIVLFAMALVLIIVLGINYACRETVPDSESCPLDGTFNRAFNGKLPM